MELRDALKLLRSELGLSQTELASALNVNYATVSRWELGKTYPNRSLGRVLTDYAKTRNASGSCVYELRRALMMAAREKFSRNNGQLYTVEHESLSGLLENATFPLYVSDIRTDEVLYLNKQAEIETGVRLAEHPGIKCYQCLLNRDKPCTFCHKHELNAERFSSFDVYLPKTNSFKRIKGKLIKWNGHDAQIRYVNDLSDLVKVSTLAVREEAYGESLKIRRQMSGDALATVHYSLTQNTMLSLECKDEEWEHIFTKYDIDEILARISKCVVLKDVQNAVPIMCTRQDMIQSYYRAQTQLDFKLYINRLGGYYQIVFSLMQNPKTFDIEAFVVARDITDEVVADEIVATLLRKDYDTICTIDAVTGKAHAYKGTQIEAVIAEQNCFADKAKVVEGYMRKYCVDEDVEGIIAKTRLSYVLEQLQKRDTYTVKYTADEGNAIVCKRVLYTYLGNTRDSILCATQNISSTKK